MVCTVTAAMSTIATIAVPDSVGIAVAIALVILLATKELATAHASSKLKLFGRYLEIAILPLLLVFALIVVGKIIEVL